MIGAPSDRDRSHATFQGPIPRRRALQVIGGTVLASIALPVVLEACAPGATASSVAVTLDIDASTLRPDDPVEIPFTLPEAGGSIVHGSAWLVKEGDGSLVAFDPRCTHARCAYAWSGTDARFECHCHRAAFDVTGKVLFGPPPRPLDRLVATPAGSRVRLEVPGDFSTPRPAA